MDHQELLAVGFDPAELSPHFSLDLFLEIETKKCKIVFTYSVFQNKFKIVFIYSYSDFDISKFHHVTFKSPSAMILMICEDVLFYLFIGKKNYFPHIALWYEYLAIYENIVHENF